MSNSTGKLDSSHEHLPTIVKSPETIRRRVDDRHWQLFEARLKKQSPEINKENYTHSNDYRVIDRFKKIDQPQMPVEPNRRWESFCHQVTTKSTETNRVMSIFHHVWLTNWNTKQTTDAPKRPMSDPALNEKTFLTCVSTNDKDKKLISTILHRGTTSKNLPTEKDKENLI